MLQKEKQRLDEDINTHTLYASQISPKVDFRLKVRGMQHVLDRKQVTKLYETTMCKKN